MKRLPSRVRIMRTGTHARAGGAIDLGPVTSSEGIAENVRRTIRASFQSIRSVPSPLTREQAPLAIWQFIRERVAYVPEYDDQFIRMPWRMWRDRVGDCKSYAVAVAWSCIAAGCDVHLRIYQEDGAEDWHHIAAIVDGCPVDPLYGYGEEMPHVRSKDIYI